MEQTQEFKEFLSLPRNIVITTHANADADALGSSLGFYHFLKAQEHRVHIIVPNSYPEFLEWMPGNRSVVIYESNQQEADQLLNEAELLCCLDFSGYNRINEMKEKVSSITAKIALIDHHLNPGIQADFNFWNDKAAATAELIFDLISALQGKESITQDIAECLYAGIMTDTGSFKHSNTTSKIHRTVAELIDLGADVNKVSQLIYDTNSLNRLRFLGYALAEKLRVVPSARVAYFVIDEKDFKNFNLKQGDTEGLVNYALSLKNIVMAAIIIERDNQIKLSFRSVGDVSVNSFAEKYFSGGGHKNAAGGVSPLSLEETITLFKELVDKNILNTIS